MKKIAANKAPRPVSDAVGPKVTAAFPLELLVELLEAVEEVPPLVAVGLVSGLALLVKQVFTPLITPLSWAESNSWQMVWLVEVV